MRGIAWAVCAALLFPELALAGDWEEINDEEGIKVWKKETEGSDFVTFRGRGVVEAPIVHIAAVIRNANRQTEWMHNCADARIVQYLNATSAVVYHRTASPVFFISDRDTVLTSKTTIKPDEKMVEVNFKHTTHDNAKPIEEAVRMPTLIGHWKLKQLAVDKTEVEYQVQADPGGSLPAWLANWASKNLPYHTLMGLRAQVTKPGYDKHRMILEVAVDWSAFALPTKADASKAGADDSSAVATP